MSRYIDAEWLLGVAKLSNGVVDIDDIYNAPSIDIVHCGECKWYNGRMAYNCRFHISKVNADDFCSYGERLE